jgi:hypothetical protein
MSELESPQDCYELWLEKKKRKWGTKGDLQFPGSSMQWKRPVGHFLSPPPGREGFMFAPCCCWYAAGGGAVGGAPELLNLLYASGGADGYIAWEQQRARQDQCSF